MSSNRSNMSQNSPSGSPGSSRDVGAPSSTRSNGEQTETHRSGLRKTRSKGTSSEEWSQPSDNMQQHQPESVTSLSARSTGYGVIDAHGGAFHPPGITQDTIAFAQVGALFPDPIPFPAVFSVDETPRTVHAQDSSSSTKASQLNGDMTLPQQEGTSTVQPGLN